MKKILKIEENKIDDMEIKIEIDILQILDHLNIVKIFEFYNYINYYFIITEFYKYGELYTIEKNVQKNKFFFIKFFLVYVIYMKIILFIKILNQKI